MQNNANVVFLGNGRGEAAQIGSSRLYRSSNQAVIHKLKDLLAASLPLSLGEMFDALDDDLYKLAETATRGTDQDSFFHAMRSLRVMRQGLERSYMSALMTQFDAFWKSSVRAGQAEQGAGGSSAELSLVAEEDLEEDLAITSMVSKANNRLYRDLFALNKRFSSLHGAVEVNDLSNPTGANALARLFQKELGAWDAGIMVRIVVYKRFDKHVLSGLKSLYEKLNRVLVEGGVLPDLSAHFTPSHSHSPAAPDEPSRDQSSTTDEAASVPAYGSGAVPNVAEIWGFMQQMIALQRHDLGLFRASMAEMAHLPELPHQHLVSELEELQQQAHDLVSDIKAESLQQQQQELRDLLAMRLGRMQSGVQTQRLSMGDQQVTDVILMLFNEMLDDPALPDAMRALLARLQIPVLKVAIVDPSFIHDVQHPARLMLNSLATASLGWSEDSDRSDNSLYGQVKHAVERVVREFKADIGLFTQINEQFLKARAEETKRTAALERRVTQAVEGEDKMDASRTKIQELYGRLDIETLPQAVQQILNDPWQKLLTIVLLREGEDSQLWKEFVATAEDLVSSVLPGEMGMTRQLLLASIPRLANQLRKGFGYISFNQNDTRRMLAELQVCHINAVRSKATVAAVPMSARRSKVVEPAAARIVEPEDEHAKAVREITEGQWVRLQLEGKEITGKLVWRSKYTGTMLFVDGQGRKVAQIKDVDLAALFRKDQGGMLKETHVPLIDRAFARMINFMRDALSPARAALQA